MKKNKIITRYDALQKQSEEISNKLFDLQRETEAEQERLEAFCKKYRSMSYNDLATCDTQKLDKIYQYFDKKYSIEWQGGLRNDSRGMALHFWVYDDPHFLILHLSSTSENICFSGSTSWLIKAKTLDNKINILKQIKKDILKILGK